jgi:hypothetical protein
LEARSVRHVAFRRSFVALPVKAASLEKARDAVKRASMLFA